MRISLFAILAASALSTSAWAQTWPGATWTTRTPESFGIDRGRLDQARDYALQGGGAGMVIHKGYLIYSWGDTKAVYDLRSTSKSIGAVTFGLAVKDGLLDYNDVADHEHPDFAIPPTANQNTGWIGLVKLEHLATHSAGFEKPGGYTEFQFQPGTAWDYSDGGANWLAEIVTLAFGEDLRTVLEDRILTPIGVDLDQFDWRDNQYRPDEIEGIPRREFGSGMFSSVDLLARVGLLHIRGGQWMGTQLLPTSFIQRVSRPSSYLAGLQPVDPELHPNVTERFGFLWWNNANGQMPGVPTDLYFSWGQFDSTIAVVPSLGLVIARAGPDSFVGDTPGSELTIWEPFFRPITEAVALPEPPAAASWLASLLALAGLARGRARSRPPGAARARAARGARASRRHCAAATPRSGTRPEA